MITQKPATRCRIPVPDRETFHDGVLTFSVPEMKDPCAVFGINHAVERTVFRFESDVSAEKTDPPVVWTGICAVGNDDGIPAAAGVDGGLNSDVIGRDIDCFGCRSRCEGGCVGRCARGGGKRDALKIIMISHINGS